MGNNWPDLSLQGGGAVSSNSSQIFTLNSSAADSYITFQTGGNNKTEVGYNSSLGTYIKNTGSTKVLNITDSGILEFNGHAILTEANIPSAAVDLANMWVILTTASTNATQALELATKNENEIDNLNSSEILDLSEKDEIMIKWTTINGIENLDRSGTSGSYYQIKQQASQYISMAGRKVYVFNNTKYVYNGKIYTYRETNLEELNSAYQELRLFLLASGLNNRKQITEGFDRPRYSELLKNYEDAELKVMGFIDRTIISNCITASSVLTDSEIDAIIV